MRQTTRWLQAMLAGLLGIAVLSVGVSAGLDWRYADLAPLPALLTPPPTRPTTSSPTLTPSPTRTLSERGDPTRGATLYAQHCAVCHGPQGEGTNVAPALRTERVQAMTPEELYTILASGIPGTAMPGWLGPLDEAALWDLVAWLLNPTQVASTPSPTPPADMLAWGAQLYAQYCASCHGVEGQGTRRAPALNTPTVVTMPAETLAQIIAQGTPNGMPGWAGILDDTAIQALVAYIQSWEGNATPSAPQPGGPRRGRGRGPWWARPTPTP
ncbi:MAG: c-type cytochrome [Chloroflexi bacterium]|nr:c-type cytochrome [Chloroflexota bacterium]